MSTDEILQLLRSADIVLEVHGDKLVIDAPVGRVTTELRDLLSQHKPALLARLQPCTEFVSLRGGLALPLPAVLAALDFERRGFKMSLDEQDQFTIEPSAGLTATDRAAIARWRLHLGAIIGYSADAQPAQ